MTAEDSKRLEVREIIRDTLAHHGHEGDELLEAPATHAAAAVGGPMTDIVARLRDQCCRLGHDDHGHTNCWLFGRAAAEIERLREENTTLRERTTPFEGDKSYSGDDERITEAFGAARSERFDRHR